ncbi:MAG: hypothetical protein IKB56_07195 [Clostridia bacterium]|nr:hypothetical protein [Clostridia bacterium]
MDGRLTITTAKNEIYFYSGCDYTYTKSDTAQISFVYESDFRKYNIVIGVNRDKLALNITSFDVDEATESTFNVLTFARGVAPRHTAVEFEYLKFNFTPEDIFVDYGKDFADLVLRCSYSTITQNPRSTVMKISVKIPTQIKE